MIKNALGTQTSEPFWSAGCMTGIARAMEFLALSLYAPQELGLPFWLQ